MTINPGSVISIYVACFKYRTVRLPFCTNTVYGYTLVAALYIVYMQHFFFGQMEYTLEEVFL